METIGEMVRKAVDLVNAGSSEAAYGPASAAVARTAAASSIDLSRFILENWNLISFMGLPNALPIPMSLPFAVKRVMPSFNVHRGPEEIVRLALLGSQRNEMLPPPFAVGRRGVFEVADGKLLLPVGLLNGLLGAVIFDPSNTEQSIEGDYWIAISDFKMFISELWGRRDLAERIIRFYQR